mmetsp:Transcript_7300/g.13656  ORF Transcript_7300/g.13656 Transcript_7300/m.13656 type:complete len:239 (-) Transcript_7300:291-1007(-)|eukprot:CAMPEP_0197524762 /NCGR_PEP_ID=MMETSP1318-20131121/9784_1 /TAXON_ID=552666 /ORGANISM="Partenskyella glossopodia, Strain RCC365" /LENGTH=238 /DNA_ID=CAMNT_0043077783 /DNA_START=14 /DNA_END=730 /DNA_ORIENTATION=+
MAAPTRRIALALSAAANLALGFLIIAMLSGYFHGSRQELGAPAFSGAVQTGAFTRAAQFGASRGPMCVWAEGNDGERQQRRGRNDRGPKFEEKVLQVRRITKVVKGGKNMGFRALVAVGDKNGKVGLGCASAKEVMVAVEKASAEAKKTAITVPITKDYSLPHRLDIQWGAANVMMKPASVGTGIIAGGAVRSLLELAGYQNARGKQLGTDNALNNAKAVIEAFRGFEIDKIKANGLM